MLYTAVSVSEARHLVLLAVYAVPPSESISTLPNPLKCRNKWLMTGVQGHKQEELCSRGRQKLIERSTRPLHCR